MRVLPLSLLHHQCRNFRQKFIQKVYSLCILYYLSLISHATYLSYIASLFSTQEEFEAFSAALHAPLPKTITLIQSCNKPQDTLDQLHEYGYVTLLSDYNRSNYITRPVDLPQEKNSKNSMPLGSTPGHLLGLFYIQETAASTPASIIDIPMSGLILDMCAAPGGKTIQLADRCMINGSSAMVWANEPDRKRGKVLYNNIVRCGMYNTMITHRDGKRFGEYMPEMFDSILLDAPCSGEGTGFKSDRGTKYRDIRKIQSIATLQWSLLQSAFKACKPGGQIMYSTCTINPIENEYNIIKLLETYGDMVSIEEIAIDGLSDGLNDQGDKQGDSHNDGWSKNYHAQLVKCKRLRPHIHHTGGFFLVSIRKQGSLLDNIDHHPKIRTTIKSNMHDSSKKTGIIVPTQDILQRLYENYKVDKSSKLSSMIFIQQGDIVYGCSPMCYEYMKSYQIDQYGIPLIKGLKPSDRRPLHTAGIIVDWGKDYQIELDDNQIISHISQKDIPWKQSNSKLNGYYQLIRRKNNVGIGKLIDETLKHKYIGVI